MSVLIQITSKLHHTQVKAREISPRQFVLIICLHFNFIFTFTSTRRPWPAADYALVNFQSKLCGLSKGDTVIKLYNHRHLHLPTCLSTFLQVEAMALAVQFDCSLFLCHFLLTLTFFVFAASVTSKHGFRCEQVFWKWPKTHCCLLCAPIKIHNSNALTKLYFFFFSFQV